MSWRETYERWSIVNSSGWPWRQRKKEEQNDAATKRLSLAMETDEERKSRLEKVLATAQLMLALINSVVNVGVFLSLNPILKSWQSFKLDVHRHPQFLSAYFFFISIPNNLYLTILIDKKHYH